MKKTLILAAGLAVTGLTTLFILITLATRDIPEPDVTDLAVSRPDLTPAENAYTWFAAATNALYWPENDQFVRDYLKGQSVDHETLRTFITKNESAIQQIRRGTTCQKCIPPEILTLQAPAPVAPFIRMGETLAAKTRYQRLSGHRTEAIKTCALLLRFADLFQQNAEGLINYLLAKRNLCCGLEQARDLTLDPNVTAAELRALLNALADLGPFTPGLIHASRTEYRMVANTVNLTIKEKLIRNKPNAWPVSELPSKLKGELVSNYIFQPNKTDLRIANMYRDLISNASLPYTKVPPDKRSKRKRNRVLIFIQPNVIGNIMCEILQPPPNSLSKAKCLTEFDARGTLLLAALQAYTKDHGAMPDRLEALVPEYLESIPVDPFDGWPFRYNPANQLIYAVGKNGTDEGGSDALPSGVKLDSTRQKRWQTEDAVFHLTPRP